MDPKDLPIRKHAPEIIQSVRTNPITVVIGETGSGKTTQISQILLEAGFAPEQGTMIGITQPRRVAAVMVSRRVAQERNVELGQEVGYAVRFEDRSSRETKIKYLTDGTLLRECLEDPTLSQYSVLVLDEAHERSLNTDILFGLLKQLATTRENPLKLVVTSATLESEKFSQYFNNCPVFKVPGRTYPVEIIHSLDDHTKNYTTAVIDTALDIHLHHPPGDILIFLTGQAEIDKAVKELNNAVRSLPANSCKDLLVLPLYAALPPDMQARVFVSPKNNGEDRETVRRCVVATNIAETSVTVDGVVYVIDTGMVKQKEYNPKTGMDSLDVVCISRVQATQRAGRAGRTQPGKCFRLYTKKFYDREMPNTTAPEIQRTSLVGAVLYLKSLRLLEIDVLKFDYLDKPKKESLEDALRQLYVLDAIDIDGKITEIGKAMSLLPLDPSLSRALIAGRELGCIEEVLTVSAMLSPESNIFIGNKGPEQLARGTDTDNSRDYDTTNNYTNQQQQQQHQSTITQHGRELLQELQRDGLGDHVFLLKLYQAWAASGYSTEWCKGMGVDGRSMRFARDIRNQLERIIGKDGRSLCVGGGGVVEKKDEEQEERISKKARRTTTTTTTSAEDFELPADLQAQAAHHSFQFYLQRKRIGFATRFARRMPLHNGFKTLGTSPALAQLHPSCAMITPDEDGLLPEWLIYHELISTGRTYLSKVCVVQESWVQHILPKLYNVDVARLGGGGGGGGTTTVSEQQQQQQQGGEGIGGSDNNKVSVGERRNAEDAVAAARARFLARKAAHKR